MISTLPPSAPHLSQEEKHNHNEHHPNGKGNMIIVDDGRGEPIIVQQGLMSRVNGI